MTVVAWDGKSMAADKLMCCGNLKKTTTKVYEIDDKIVGFAGALSKCFACLDWVRNSYGDIDKFPRVGSDDEDYIVEILVYDRTNKTLMYYENCPFPIPIDPDTCVSIGSGLQFAEMAMKLGKTAKEAVEVVSELCIYCGAGVDVFYVEE